jgi:hypothetical protein
MDYPEWELWALDRATAQTQDTKCGNEAKRSRKLLVSRRSAEVESSICGEQLAIIAHLEAARAEDMKDVRHPSRPPWMYEGTRGGWRPQEEIRRAIYVGWRANVYRLVDCGSFYRSLAESVKRGLIKRDVIKPREHERGYTHYPRLQLPPSKRRKRAIRLYATLDAPDLRFLSEYRLEAFPPGHQLALAALIPMIGRIEPILPSCICFGPTHRSA